jgi:hypothetical protein
MRLALALCALLAVIGWADVERPILRLATGRDEVRVVVIVPQHADHRWLRVDGAVFDAAGEAVWERASWEQLEGAQAPKSRTLWWRLPRANPYDVGARTLRVRAAVICETAEGAAFIP